MGVTRLCAVTGGRNGYGAKLANIFSTEFVLETNDSESGQHFRQVFRNNMSEKEAPVISPLKSGGDFTCVSFKPDLRRFKMSVRAQCSADVDAPPTRTNTHIRDCSWLAALMEVVFGAC